MIAPLNMSNLSQANRTNINAYLGTARDRRGAALVLAVILIFSLFGMLAFSIDSGFLAGAKAEMRRSADAASLAGCWQVYDRLDAGKSLSGDISDVYQAASKMASANDICNASPTVSSSSSAGDVKFGYLSSPSAAQISSDNTLPFFGVRVKVQRTADKNGEIPFFFGRIFGDVGRGMTTSATAVMAKQIKGFQLDGGSSSTLDMLPFALDEVTWNQLMAGNASDSFSFDPQTGAVRSGSDGVQEVNLYPQGTGSPGNRGTVDIGGANNSTSDIARQIVHGISSGDLAALGKPLTLDNGALTLNGDTGISAGVKDELASIIGKKRIIPIFSSVSGNGNNATYTITKWVGVRVLNVQLTGKMSSKAVVVQPAPMISQNAIISTSGGSFSEFVLSPAFLAQ